MSKIKKLAGETVLYGLGSIVPRSLNFLLVPLHTRNMFSPEEYGVYTNLMAYVAFLNVVYMFGMETAYFRYATVPDTDRQRVFRLAQTVVVSISLLLSVLFITMASPIASVLHIANHPDFIAWLALVMFLDALVAIPFARLRLEKKPLKFAMAKIINVVIAIGLNFYFLKVSYDPGIGIGLVFLANLLANSFYLVFFLRELFTWRPLIDRIITPRMLTYAYPVMLMGVVGTTNEMFSRLTLEWWLPVNYYGNHSSAHALGVLGACYKYAVVMGIALQAFRFAAEPFFFSNAPDQGSAALFARVNHYFIIVCCVLWLAVSINMDIFKYFIGEEFWEGLPIVPILLLAYLFLGIYYNFSVWYKVTDRTYYGTIITAAGAVLTIFLNYLLVPVAGYTGSAWAALIVYASMAVTCYWLGQRYYPIPYRVMTDAGYVLVTFLLILLVSRIALSNPWLNSAFHGVVVVVFVGVIFLLEKKGEKPPAGPQGQFPNGNFR